MRALALVALLVLCGASAAHAQGAPRPVPVRIAISPSNDDTAPLLYAKATGMFERAGLDVQIQRMRSSSAIAAAVVGGAIDIGKSTLSGLVNAHEKGIPFTIVAGCAMYDRGAPFDALLVPSDSPARSGKDLNGKVLSTQSLNDIGEVATDAWIDAHGGDSSTVKYVEIPVSATVAALEAHRIAGAIVLEPFLDPALASGKVRSLGPAFAAIAPHYLFAAWFTTSDWARKHPGLTKAFASVVARAGAYTNAHHAEAARVVAPLMDAPVAVVEHARWSVAPTSPALDPADIQPLIEIAAKYHAIAKPFPARELTDGRP